MPDAGHTWRLPFPGLPDQAARVREWVRIRLAEHADAEAIDTRGQQLDDLVLIANELFIAVLATRPGKIEMTVSTSGDRARIYATGPYQLPIRARAGLGIIQGLAVATGSRDDNCTVWAEARIGRRR